MYVLGVVKMTEKRNYFKFKDGKPIGAVIYASDNMNKKRFKLEDIGFVYDNGTLIDMYDIVEYLNALHEENEQLKDALNQRTKQCDKYYDENERLKQDKFICLDCKYSGYTEIGCLCEKEDHWTDYKTECKDYEELE